MAAHKRIANINLLVKDKAGNSFSEQFLAWILSYGRYIIIITQIIVLSVFFLRFKIDRDHTDLKELVTQKQAIIESLSDLEGEIRSIQGRLTYISTISPDQDSLIKVIRFIQQKTPVDIIFTNLSISTEKISFQANSENLLSFSFMLNQFQRDKKFSEVSLLDFKRMEKGRINFKIEAKLRLTEFI